MPDPAAKANAAEPSAMVGVVWEGGESDLAEPFVGAVLDPAEWELLWMKAFHKKAPAVDFDRFAVACVFLGHYPGWWYRIGFGEPRVAGRDIIVPYELVTLVVEVAPSENGLLKKQGNRGQYAMKTVARRPGFSLRLELVGTQALGRSG